MHNCDMLRVYADFNDRTPDGGCWLLQYSGVDVAAIAEQLGLSIGDQVMLFQDQGDFEVTARLAFGHVDVLGRDTWIAYPDWGTLRRLAHADARATRT